MLRLQMPDGALLRPLKQMESSQNFHPFKAANAAVSSQFQPVASARSGALVNGPESCET
jgi:hypothetical protein